MVFSGNNDAQGPVLFQKVTSYLTSARYRYRAGAVREEFVVHCLEGYWSLLTCQEPDLGAPPGVVRCMVLPVCTRDGDVFPLGPQRP